MKYMLDTNICIYAMKNNPQHLVSKMINMDPDDLCISVVTYAELMHGVEKSKFPEGNKLAVNLFLSPIKILDFDMKAAEEYGSIKADLQKKGMPIGPFDTLIAAHAKVNGLTLVTNNTSEFERVSDLKITDWSAVS